MTATSAAGSVSDDRFHADVELLEQTWADVARDAELVEEWLEVAGEPVRLRIAGPAMAGALRPALGHLRIDAPADRAAALTIHAWDSAGTGTRLPPLSLLPAPGDPPAPTSHAFGDGAFWYQPVDAVLSVLRGTDAWWCVPDAAAVAPPERAAPFKAVFHWWLAGRGLHLVHAGAVGAVDGSAGVLLPGPGGAGKSTTVARCARAGLPVAGDDFVIVGTDPPTVWSLYGTVKLMPHVVAEGGWPEARLPDCGEKSTLLLDDVRGGSLRSGFPLTRVALPRVADQPSTTSVPARAAEVVMALAPWTLLQLPMPRQEAFDAARAIAERVPAATLRLGSEPSGVVAGVAALLVPRVSVVVPVRNGAAFLDEALASVSAQGVDGVEVVVVDDGSTDGSAEVAAAHRGVRVVAGAGEGPAAARNLGLCRTTSPIVAFLDADDRWPPGRLATMLAHLDANPRTGVVLGRQVALLDGGATEPAWMREPADWIPLPMRTGLAPQVPAMSMVVRRDVVSRVGFFDPTLPVCEDLDWYVRAAEAGVRIDLLDDVVLERRIHDRNLSHDQAAMTRGALAALQRKLERARRRERWPAVSVVIPCHDHGRYLGEAIESVLSQDRPPLEVVVVDDGSTDDTPEVAARYAPWVRLVRQPQGGIGRARNAATPFVAGDAVLWLDADDRLAPGALEVLARALDDGADMARGRIDEFLTPGLDDATRARLREPRTGVDAPLIGGHLVRTATLHAVGPFDDALGRGEGIDWLHRAATAGVATAVVDAVTVERRFHAANSALRHPGRDGDLLLVARAALARRRAAAGGSGTVAVGPS